MEKKHTFMLEPGYWYGEGTVTLGTSEDKLSFLTEWEVMPGVTDEIDSLQIVKLEGSEPRNNQFRVYDVAEGSFKILLENDIVGKVSGRGVIDGERIAWEFRESASFQGYEIYEIENEDIYKFHAEYTSSDQYRTIIDGYLKRTQKSSG